DGYLGDPYGANTGSSSPTGFVYADYLCPDVTSAAIATRFQQVLGVTAQDQVAMAQPLGSTGVPCSTIPGLQAGFVSRTANFLNTANLITYTRSLRMS